jgi:hypothetical protein
MKDRLGHGSNPRATHQGGVLSIGLPHRISDKTANVVHNACTSPQRCSFSVSPQGKTPKDGYMVSMPHRTELMRAEEIRGHEREALASYARKNHDIFNGNKNMFFGGWAHKGKVYVDPSENVRDLEAAKALGRARNQIAIWDVKGHREINTGGTGL